jgi:hypothetical protein
MDRTRQAKPDRSPLELEMDISNWINLGIFVVTALVGILAWLGTRQAAREARSSQEAANAAAARSASAAEDATRLQRRMVEIESQRHEEAALDARRARLKAEKTRREVHRFNRIYHDDCLTIFNTGRVTAVRLDVRVNDRPLAEYDEFPIKLPDNASVGPDGRLDLLFMLFMGGRLRVPFDVRLTWDDESGLRGDWNGTVG